MTPEIRGASLEVTIVRAIIYLGYGSSYVWKLPGHGPCFRPLVCGLMVLKLEFTLRWLLFRVLGPCLWQSSNEKSMGLGLGGICKGRTSKAQLHTRNANRLCCATVFCTQLYLQGTL